MKRGHTVENHSQHHLHYFSLLGPRRMGEELQAAQDTFASITGEAPRFFRAPAGLRSPFLDPVLARLDLHLASWTRRAFDTQRVQFGRPIVSFQGLQFLVADLAAEIEAARLMIYRAASLMDLGEQCVLEAAMERGSQRIWPCV